VYTALLLLGFLILALVLRYHYYTSGYDRGHEDGASFLWPELQEEIKEDIPSEPMVPQSLVNSILEDAKRVHEDTIKMVSESAAVDLKRWKADEEKKIRADAIQRHKNVTKGKTTEHLIPYMDEFEFNPSDCRFMGSPIDIVVFDGLSDGDVKEVVFLEIKTGSSANLSTRERKVRDAIKAGRVSWRLVRKK